MRPRKLNEETKVRKKPKIRFGSVFLKFVLIFCVFYIVINVILEFKNSIVTYTVQNGQLEDYITVDGYIFRDQNILYAPSDGYLQCDVSEDERVSKGQRVASIYKSEINFSANERLSKINDEIAKIKNNNLENDLYANDVVRVEQKISDEIKNIPIYGYMNTPEQISETKDKINDLIDKKRVISGEKTYDENTLRQLEEEKAKIESGNNVEKIDITAPNSGVFTSRIDGFEQDLSVDRLNAITPSYLENLNSKAPQNNTKVSSGSPICKVVNNFEWYFAYTANSDEADSLTLNQEVGVRFFDVTDKTIQGEISKISNEENGKKVVVIKLNNYIESIYSTSRATVEIVKNKYSGIKIPLDGIRIKDGQKGAYIVKYNTADFVPIDVLYNDKEWAIVKPLENISNSIKLYDEVIIYGKNLSDGKVVK